MNTSFLRVTENTVIPENLRGGAIAIGNFDGLHIGHLTVLEAALNLARANNRPAIVLTFEPHPRALFQPSAHLARITPAPMKAQIIKALGFDAVIEIPFTHEFSQKSADAFIDDILVAALGAKHVVTGFDFHFGKRRQGGPAFLIDAGEKRGFSVKLVDAVRDKTAEVISSSRIRWALAHRDIALANQLLGYHYRVGAEISHGQKLGRTLGYPTANMEMPLDTPLAEGIYAVRFTRADGTIYDGVASFGRRPTVVEQGAPLLETFLFDFTGDLYGENCCVSVVKYLRGEEKFDGLDPLIAQMKLDEQNAREALKDLKPLSPLDETLTFSGTTSH